MQPNINVTEPALEKLANLLSGEEKKLYLRIHITGGGCSGFKYIFSFEDKYNDDDWVFEKKYSKTSQEVLISIDPLSFNYLIDAELDFISDVTGEQFVINNPNAKSTCGCGSSFTIE